ncbi:alpha/beta fold hydrolase [Nitrospirillum iridis]|uniref:Pimeloyl-ACP methyl ester carboxylesterase n=1 Tax=Nitrospirillum iridis TaxID=765888 RepID=A0A7X0B463_9PROT|nr:alpha/beta fold hydrolase [Nitrospirillum iridis]MBB6255062.1 pimeloyl-ACP methyl ester carboxylesterase [Nitrospirillum iridis]
MSVAITRGYTNGRYGQVHYRVARPAGPTAGRPLVLFHQNPSSSFEYEPLIAEMATDRVVLALDTPGYGMSDRPPAPLTIAGYATALVEVLPDLGVTAAEGCDVYGFHTGALLSIEAALARPDLVRRVAVTGMPMRTAEEAAALLEVANTAPSVDEAGEMALGMAKRLWDYVVTSRAAGAPLRRAADNWVDKLRVMDRGHWAYVAVWSYQYQPRLPLVTQPVLVLQPNEDIRDLSLAAAALLPNHRIVEMPEWDRDIFDLPAAVTRMGVELRQFLDQP